jgi:hypothetical protein
VSGRAVTEYTIYSLTALSLSCTPEVLQTITSNNRTVCMFDISGHRYVFR